MKDINDIKTSFRKFLISKIGKRGFGIYYDENDNIHFVVDVDEKDFSRVRSLIPKYYHGVIVDIRQIRSSSLLVRNIASWFLSFL